MIFGAIYVLFQGQENQGLKYEILRDKHGNQILWYLDLFYPSFKVGQTKVENVHFFRVSRN